MQAQTPDFQSLTSCCRSSVPSLASDRQNGAYHCINTQYDLPLLRYRTCYHTPSQTLHSVECVNLADILDRVLDKGIVIAGDIKIQLADVDLLNIKIRLLVASAEKAMEMGINWWQHDDFLSSKAMESSIKKENETLKKRVESLEKRLTNKKLNQGKVKAQ